VTADRVFGLAAAALAALFLLFGVPTIEEEWRRGVGARYFTVGPRLFPYIAGVLCLVFAILIALLPRAAAGDGAAPARTTAGGGSPVRAAALMAVALAYVASLTTFGFVAASILMLLVFMVGFGYRVWPVVVPVAILAPPAVDWAFLRLLRLELPPGVYGLGFGF